MLTMNMMKAGWTRGLYEVCVDMLHAPEMSEMSSCDDKTSQRVFICNVMADDWFVILLFTF